MSELALVTVDPQPPTPGSGHLFSALFPADSDGSDQPLFVLFNGGPGVPTTTGLLANSTAPNAFVEDAQCHGSVVANPASFTALGPLLYLEQRDTGFSYDDSDGSAYRNTFDTQADAIDFTRAIIRVMDGHPQLTGRRVVILGESYGGLRAQLILHDLLHYTDVPALAAEVKAHFDAVFGTEALHAPGEVAQQFFAQVLVEPVVMGAYQALLPPRADDACTSDTRLTCPVPESSPTLYSVMADPQLGSELFGGRLEAVAGLSGPDRHGARLPGDMAAETNALNAALVQRMGTLDAADYYFGQGPSSGDTDWFADKTVVPPAFVDNLGYVRTLITNGVYDGILDTTQIAPALVAYGVPAKLDQHPRRGTARPGWIDVTLPDGRVVTIRMPAYAAGHQVTETQTQAQALRADTADWLGLPL